MRFGSFRNWSRFALCLAVSSLATVGQTTTSDVGSGSPNAYVLLQFEIAYYRNGFSNLVSYPPLADVKKLGTNGLVQEFADANKTSGVKLALIMPDSTVQVAQGTDAVHQVQASMYAYFTSAGLANVGMPTMDTANCPALLISNSCQYQLFDKPAALFVFKNSINGNGTTFGTVAPYYSTWLAAGGVTGLGPAESSGGTITASTGTTANAQYFDRGAIYILTSGSYSGQTFTVQTPVYTVYTANNGDQGFLGVPVGNELVLANGHRRQAFEGGSIEYDPSNPSAAPVIRMPVSSISISGQASPVRLQLGDAVTLQAAVYDAGGVVLTDRQISWTTSNGRVVSVTQTGASTTVKATGGGTATVAATSEGKISASITFIVTAPCCQVGEGAPTTAIAQAFQDALTRNRLTVQVPAASSVVREGTGYVQQFTSADGTAVYLVAVSDTSSVGFVVTGALLTSYLALGGPAGSVGYPTADATSGGRQNFQNATLAGSPIQAVTGDILTKWAAIGYETGVAGNPTGPVASVLTFRATTVKLQPFVGAEIESLVSGLTSKVFAISGLILTQYTASGGAAGHMGAALSDEYASSGRRRQDFEGGYIDYASGDAQATAHESARQPVLTASPAAVPAGTRVRIAAGGFDDSATVRVSQTGQADFTVTVANGAYVWENFIAATAKAATITVTAVDTSNKTKTAQASYTVQASADVRLQLAVSRGDGQTGLPGALLASPLVASVKDASGNPVSGWTVGFAASPGATVSPISAVTDSNGEAATSLRLPSAQGVALVTASAAHSVATFSARSAASSLTNFPALSQQVSGVLGNGPATIASKGAMLTAVASILRYYQARGDAPVPNGLADVAGLNAYLKGVCALDLSAVQVCDGFVLAGGSPDPIVNLWRVPAFAGSALTITPGTADPGAIRDWLAQGVPVLVALDLAPQSSAPQPHFVTAIGVNSDGSIAIADPNPSSGRSTLDQYLAAGSAIAGTTAIIKGSAAVGGFLVAANATVQIASSAGACGSSFEIAVTGSSRVQFRYCDGGSPLYEVDLGGSLFSGFLTDLGPQIARYDLSGTATGSYKVSRPASVWVVGPLALTLAANGVVNGASFTSSLAPGGFVSIFGAGFGSDPKSVSIDFDGTPGTIVAAFPFQVNAVIPAAVSPGTVSMGIATASGSVRQDIQMAANAPALFTLSGSQGAILNKDNSINGTGNPAQRGDIIVVFGTGFGAVTASGQVMKTVQPVTATIGGLSAPILFSGLAPGYPGLYQINISLPVSLPPGLTLPLSVQQGNVASNTVQVAVQ